MTKEERENMSKEEDGRTRKATVDAGQEGWRKRRWGNVRTEVNDGVRERGGKENGRTGGKQQRTMIRERDGGKEDGIT